jgi:hypothetical protein
MGDFANRPGILYLKTSNDDKNTPAASVMWTLDVDGPSRVYLNFRGESHVSSVSHWLEEEDWQLSTMKTTVSTGIPNWLYWGPVYSKEFEEGKIELRGSNCPLGTYFVFLELLEGM